MTEYLLDSSVLIGAHNTYCDMDVFPGFWEWLDKMNEAKMFYSVEAVYTEVMGHEDNLKAWAGARGEQIFLPADNKVVSAYSRVINWVNGQDYTQNAIDDFLKEDRADAWIIAHAMAYGRTVVSHEEPGGARRKVKIPDVCVGLGVPHKTLFEVQKQVMPLFVLQAVSRPPIV